MTATTVDAPTDAAAVRPLRRSRTRFAVAFLAGLLGALALGAGALYAYDRQYEGRILPGVHVGALDLSGLSPDAAHERIAAAYRVAGDGQLVLTAGERTFEVAYADLGRAVDVDGLVAQAVAAGREGGPLERAIANARTALRGVTLEPSVEIDEAALAAQVERAAARLDRQPRDATVATTGTGFALTKGSNGVRADRDAAFVNALAALTRLDAPARVTVEIPLAAVEPRITTDEAAAGKAAAERMAADLEIAVGDESFTLEAATIRSWITVKPTVDGRMVAVPDVTKISPALKPIGEAVRKDPKNASFLVSKDNKVVGVTAGRDGQALNFATTSTLVLNALSDRRGDVAAPKIEAATIALKPTLSTEEAEKAAPLMKRISTWTTWFPISEKNGFGANIWIPAEDIDGYVVGPGEWFDFWKAVGPVTRERGYKSGGAIINGRTEPQGALAGGICSCSTTLFNAALRAGFEMGARRNHYYYIDRYPLGLDATVFKSGSGSVQTMSWHNDTKYPVLIRGFRIRDGGKGYVRFDLYSVPNGRTVSFSKPIVKNVRPARDTVQYTSSLAPGASKRIEFPVAGKDVWVTRTVRDANGAVIRTETYYSHYSRVDGIVLVGRAAATDTQDEPAPTPTP